MKTNWQTKKQEEIGKGGDAGEVFIAARKIVGNGSITANGGDGSVGGKGGRITIISEDNQFTGQVEALGGKSIFQSKKWWETNWFQATALLGTVAGIIGLVFLFI